MRCFPRCNATPRPPTGSAWCVTRWRSWLRWWAREARLHNTAKALALEVPPTLLARGYSCGPERLQVSVSFDPTWGAASPPLRTPLVSSALGGLRRWLWTRIEPGRTFSGCGQRIYFLLDPNRRLAQSRRRPVSPQPDPSTAIDERLEIQAALGRRWRCGARLGAGAEIF